MFVNFVSLHMPQFKFAKNFVGDRRLSMRPENLEMNVLLKNNLRALHWGGGGKATMIFNHWAYVRVSWSWSKNFLTMTMAKILKLSRSNGQKFLP